VLTGRLAILPNIKSSMLDLYHVGNGNNPAPLLDSGLQALIATSWKDLELIAGRQLPTPRPIPVTNRPHWHWLCRLVPARYVTEANGGGGFALFQILGPARRGLILTRPAY
jgi:hypothetical protein